MPVADGAADCAVDATFDLADGSTVAFGDEWRRLSSRDGLPARLRLTLRARGGATLSLVLAHNRSLRSVFSQPSNRTSLSLLQLQRSFCYYTGKVEKVALSHAAVNLCNGQLNGLVWTPPEHVILESTASQVLALPSSHSSLTCDSLRSIVFHPSTQRVSPSFQMPRSTQCRFQSKRSSLPLPSYYDNYLDGQERYLELVLVSDRRLFVKYNMDEDLMRDRLFSIANFINTLFYPLNIHVSLAGIEIWKQSDRVTLASDSDYTLRNFRHYRTNRLLKRFPHHDNAQLITAVSFEDGVLGKAHQGTMCSRRFSAGVSSERSRRIADVAATVAHEMGHNLGMRHDVDRCHCPHSRCLMSKDTAQSVQRATSPSNNVGGRGAAPTHWSECSLEYLARGLARGTDYCLRDKPSSALVGAQCGNGVVEPGEQCDCGPRPLCDNACCDAATCTLAAGAECAAGACCDLSTCRVRPATWPCRPATDECDLAEYCSGAAAQCAADVHKQDGLSCNSEQAVCYAGKCGSRDGRCEKLWGEGSRGADAACYDLNLRGTTQGDCGYDAETNIHQVCQQSHVQCGRLHCEQRRERPEFGGDPSMVQWTETPVTLDVERAAVCSVARFDLAPDPGLVPDGALCSDDASHICVRQQCVRARTVRSAAAQCTPPDCHGRGLCNSNGHCHCFVGFGGASCERRGLGGSVDSGPATVPASLNFGVILLLLFLLAFLASLVAFYIKRKNSSCSCPDASRLLARWRRRRSLRKAMSDLRSRSDASTPLTPPQPVVFRCPVASDAAATPRVAFRPNTLSRNEISPPIPSKPPPGGRPLTYSVPASMASHTLPRSQRFATAKTDKQQSIDSSHSRAATLRRQTSLSRPKKPAPPPPRRATQAIYYAPVLKDAVAADTTAESLVRDVMAALGEAGAVSPKRRAPLPPANANAVIEQPHAAANRPSPNTPPPEDPIATRRPTNTAPRNSRPAAPPPPPPPKPNGLRLKMAPLAVYDSVAVTSEDEEEDSTYEQIPADKAQFGVACASANVRALAAKFNIRTS